jgi:hypothetical protein
MRANLPTTGAEALVPGTPAETFAMVVALVERL